MAGDVLNPTQPLTSFTCESCGAPVAIRGMGLTLTAICSACGSISDSENGTFKLVKKSLKLMPVKPMIPLGTKGKLRGKVCQLIGFMRRFENEYPSDPWDEYLLIDQFGAYYWLVENKGHWNFFRVTKSTPSGEFGKTISFLGDTYQVFHRGNAVVQFVVGEFYWRVRVGDSVKTLDAICPPHMLSLERSDQEAIWALGEYLQPREVAAAFHPNPMPSPQGVAPNQPASVNDLNSIWSAWAFVLLILLLVQVFGTSLKRERPLPGERVTVPATGVSDVEVVKFSTADSSTHITLDVSASVVQSWTTVSLRVVPENPSVTASHTFEKDLSFYSGYDGGEYWSEGSQRAEFLINGLPRGNYRVLLSATPEPGHTVDISTSVEVAPTVWSNFWLACFLLTLPPAWMSFRSISFERSRWSESELSPFENGES